MRRNQDKIAYSGRFVQVKESIIDGYKWEKVFLPDSLVVFPIDSQNRIVMIEEKRPHETTPSRLKFVTGHLEPNENTLLSANREMMEEIGFSANKLVEFYKHESSGTLNSNFHFVAARDLEPKKIPNPDGEDSILNVIHVPILEIESMLHEHRLN
ncbi:MAG: NUDIX hydrolase, partial [Bacteriovoracaceae bacterium]|nr:NUDIX hydrolase [Bacteriovoracaceae bacterium]